MSEWQELVIEGKEEAVRAFVTGFLAGRGSAGDVLFGADCALESASLGERLRGLLGLGAHTVLFAPAPLADALAAPLAAAGDASGLRLVRRCAVASASFALRVEVFSRAQARDIRTALLDGLPEGVVADGLAESEETHPEAHGPEPFAPLHEYVYRAAARITGVLPAVVEVRRRAERDFVEAGPLHVEGKPLDG